MKAVQPGVFRRGVDSLGMGADRTRFLAAHRPGVAVQYEGYTSVMIGTPYAGDLQLSIHAAARDIGAFSVASEPELVLPRQTRLRIAYVVESSGEPPGKVIVMYEERDTTAVPPRRQFGTDADLQEARALAEAVERRRRDGPPPTQAELDRYERMQVEAGGPMPARFKHLQYIDKARRQR